MCCWRKIVGVLFATSDIDAKDEDESWKVRSRLSLSGCSESSLTRIFDDFKEFVGNHDFRELKDAARTELKTGKTSHLSNIMHDFYFRQ
ncbi:hypothetical protein COV15_01470 [Candidatus Woesearchaeota archaeon CG10_big_fil_rev_8_21_14_0_10_34_12]|nr:MAG: hypothetical protein COV15_01470 [Candidatus Woesearchaeota archaeon CG10_big_fil_rev_8_21_14_0_10_34_12]